MSDEIDAMRAGMEQLDNFLELKLNSSTTASTSMMSLFPSPHTPQSLAKNVDAAALPFFQKATKCQRRCGSGVESEWDQMPPKSILEYHPAARLLLVPWKYPYMRLILHPRKLASRLRCQASH